MNSLISDSSEISDLSEHEEPENQPETITSASRSTCSASGELGRVLIFLYQNPLHLNHGLFPKNTLVLDWLSIHFNNYLQEWKCAPYSLPSLSNGELVCYRI